MISNYVRDTCADFDEEEGCLLFVRHAKPDAKPDLNDLSFIRKLVKHSSSIILTPKSVAHSERRFYR